MWKFDIKRRKCEKEVGEAGRTQGKGNRTFATQTNTQRICLKEDLWSQQDDFFSEVKVHLEEQQQEKGVQTPVAADDNMLGSTGINWERAEGCAILISKRTA